MATMDRKTGKVVSHNTKQAYCETKVMRDHIPVNACELAKSLILPPHIFQQAFPSGPYGRDEPDETL